ncbi:MAG: hypothetical protein RhofKO_26480 [Rhodothermales bacterium]
MVAAFNARDLPGLVHYYAEGYVGMDLSLGLQHHSRAELAHAFRKGFHAFPDAVVTLHDVTCWSQRTVVAWSLEGTHRGAFMHIPATGQRVAAVGTSFYRLKDGLITQALHLWDVAGMLRAMRLLPEWPVGHRLDQQASLQAYFQTSVSKHGMDAAHGRPMCTALAQPVPPDLLEASKHTAFNSAK